MRLPIEIRGVAGAAVLAGLAAGCQVPPVAIEMKVDGSQCETRAEGWELHVLTQVGAGNLQDHMVHPSRFKNAEVTALLQINFPDDDAGRTAKFSLRPMKIATELDRLDLAFPLPHYGEGPIRIGFDGNRTVAGEDLVIRLCPLALNPGTRGP